jgi:hypothetical protein
MALRILDGNQTSTTLATTVSGGAHYPNHILASSVTISSLPAISGTVTANVLAGNTEAIVARQIAVGEDGDDFNSGTGRVAVSLVDNSGNSIVVGGFLPISGTVSIGSALPTGTNRIGVVTIGGGTVTIGAGTALMGSVTLGTGTAQIGSVSVSGSVVVSGSTSVTSSTSWNPASSTLVAYVATDGAGAVWRPIPLNEGASAVNVTGSIDAVQPLYPFTNTPKPYAVTVGNSITISSLPALVAGTAQIGSVTASISNSITISSLPAISGTVTISAQPSGALTTRFGSVVAANTAQITTSVTNTSRKYLLAQNISAGTVTIGIGFSPTTTQGIQLTAEAGLTFDSFVPTGAVYWLGATTGAAYTILEG